MKRVLDLIAAVAGTILLSPVFLAVALAVRMALGRPVLFRQTRPGYRERPFTLYKFRTMTDAVDRQGDPLPDEERLTRTGQFLRYTSLDELPQLWNVLRGEMSLVGPRPLLLHYLPRYTPEQRRRHEVLPGLTGWAQVTGRNCLSWHRKLQLDTWYVDHRSLWLDLRILAMTLRTLFLRRGIRHNGHVTMPEFLGSSAGHDL
jgi:lipopolysaccharide/colanic/teichoic acid biosynthesis glycosyltransferase